MRAGTLAYVVFVVKWGFGIPNAKAKWEQLEWAECRKVLDSPLSLWFNSSTVTPTGGNSTDKWRTMMAKQKIKRKNKSEDQAELAALVNKAPTHEEIAQGANLASGVPADEPNEEEEVEEVHSDSVAEQTAVEGEADEEERLPSSVVAVKFKDRYIANARDAGIPGKAAKRSNWDWLSQTIASQVLNEKHKISIESFTAILDANGVDHTKWTNRNKGWEGRFRMTGRVALQRKVADSGKLILADGSESQAPADWVEKFKTKA